MREQSWFQVLSYPSLRNFLESDLLTPWLEGDRIDTPHSEPWQMIQREAE